MTTELPSAAAPADHWPPPVAPPLTDGPGAPGPPGPPGPPADLIEAGHTPRRWRFAPRSLTARLVIGVAVIVAVVVVATGIGTYIALRSFLYQRLDQQLSPLADANQRSVQRCFELGQQPCFVPVGLGVSSSQRTWLEVLDEQGNDRIKVPPNNRVVEPIHLSAPERADVLARPNSVRSWEVGGTTLRVTARRVLTPGLDLVVVTGLSTGELDKTLDHLLKLETIIGGSALVLALVATGGGVRFSLRRLRRITRTAQDVAAELSPEGTGLDRRVPVTEPGTEVGQLAESMNTLLSAVETQFAARLDSERRMRQFLADASHELRTPLTSIRGYAELARMQRAVGGSDEDNLERIESEGTRMSRLVEDLLTLARGDQGSLPERAPIDVTDLLADVTSGARAAFPGRAIAVEAPVGLQIIGDRDQLVRVVRNLVTNAAVHTRPDGVITVRGFVNGPGVALQVIDQGPGLPPQEAVHVFERFWRADKARTRSKGGSGLGLAIVTSVVQAHGGTVRFDSTIEQGSTVTVWLPRGTA